MSRDADVAGQGTPGGGGLDRPRLVDRQRSIVVGDDVIPGPGQIRRGELMERGSEIARLAADDELAAVGRSADTCPHLKLWLARFATYDVAPLERAVVLFARPTAAGGDAYLGAVDARVRQAVRTWIASGRVELPAGLTDPHPGGEVAALQRRTDPDAPATPPIVALVAGLGPGGPLPPVVRAPMERSVGTDLSTVRIHTDAAAADAARAHRARAMTVGDHVMFGSGHFDASSLSGRALIAHELAHVVQQRGSGGVGDERAEERDADSAAAAALQDQPFSPPRRGGLALRRCSTEGTEYDPADHEDSHARLARRTPERMIADHTTGAGDLDEDGLAQALADMLWYSPGDHAAYVRSVFQSLESHNTDDVAGLMLAKLSDRDLAIVAAKPTGRALLEYLVPELEEGWTFPGSDLHAATRAARAAVARRSSAVAARAEIDAMEEALSGVPAPVGDAPTGVATVAERRALVTSKLADFDRAWVSSPGVRSAVSQVRRGLAATTDSSRAEAARLPYAQASLPAVQLLLGNVEDQLRRVRQNPSGTSAAAADLLLLVRREIVHALALTFEADGPRQLARAQAAYDHVGPAMTRLELAVLGDRPSHFAAVRPKLDRLRSFARWADAELAQVRVLRPATTAEVESAAHRLDRLMAASRVLAHWEVLIQTAEALESGFSFTEAFYRHDVDVDSIHGDLAQLAGLAESGSHQAFVAGVDAFAARSEIQAYYESVPRILRSSGIAVGIMITVAAGIATMGAGSYLGIGAGVTAASSTATVVGTSLAATVVDALVFTSVHQLLAAGFGQEGGGTFFEELAWNFGLFGVLRLGGGLLGRSLANRGLSRAGVGAAQLAGAAGLLEVYGVFRFWLAEGRLPSADELRLMTGEMLVVLALLVAVHVTLKPRTPLGRFDREFGGEFRAIEAERAQLQADVDLALREGRMADAEAGFRQRGEALERRTRTWAERAAASSGVPAVRNQLQGMQDIQQRAGAYLAESLGLPAEADVQSAGPSTDFTIAHGTVLEVRQSMSARGAEVNLLEVEGQPTVVEARFPHGEVVHFAERSPSARQRTHQRHAAERDPASEEAAELAPDLAPEPSGEASLATRFPNLFDAQGRLSDAQVEVDYQSYRGRGGAADRAAWTQRTGGGPLARLRAWLGPDFRPPRSRRHADRPRLTAVPNPVPIRSFRYRVREALRAREQQILELGERDALQAGVEYQELIAADLYATDVQEWSQRPHRRNDIGGGAGSPAALRGKEVTIEGRRQGFSTSKLDQLWLDLEQTGGIDLTVPRLSQAARSQLGRMVRQFIEAEPGRTEPSISIRETLPDGYGPTGQWLQ